MELIYCAIILLKGHLHHNFTMPISAAPELEACAGYFRQVTYVSYSARLIRLPTVPSKKDIPLPVQEPICMENHGLFEGTSCHGNSVIQTCCEMKLE